jgi:hypothetical protein
VVFGFKSIPKTLLSLQVGFGRRSPQRHGDAEDALRFREYLRSAQVSEAISVSAVASICLG